MRRWSVLFRVAVLFAVNPAVAGAETSAAVRDAQFEIVADQIADSDEIVGLAVAIVRDGEPVLVRTWGPREMGGSEAVNPRTVFRVASLSKAFATGLVAQLVAEGKLKLSALATDYSRDFRLKDRGQLRKATLENVLSHRLGLPPNAYDNLLEANMPPGRILRRLARLDLICRVGQCYSYQNVAFNVIADAIEAADGRPIETAMAERFFKPLNMVTASVGMEGLRRTGNWARPHRRRRGKSWRAVPVKPVYYHVPAAAGVNASITDMASWLAAQMGNAPEVLSPEMLSMLQKPRAVTPRQFAKVRRFLPITSAHYGLGWRVYDYQGETVISHTGSVDGYAAQITFVPSRNAGLVLLCNSRSRTFYALMPVWLRLELGVPGPPKEDTEPETLSGGGTGAEKAGTD